MFIEGDAPGAPLSVSGNSSGGDGGGSVCLVGAGPGDPDLLTVRALRLIESAEAIVYDRLVSPEVLSLVPETVRMIAVGKAPQSHPVPQDRINRILVDLARKGLRVVRLKGGDPMIFGRGAEEAAYVMKAGIPVELVPGITSAQGASAVTGIPLTHRGIATGVRYLTGQCRAGQPLEADWAGLAEPGTTLVVYMGLARIDWIASQLAAHGMPPGTPVMAISNVTTPRQRRTISTLSEIGKDARDAGLEPPTLFVIGKVVELAHGSALPFGTALERIGV